MTQVTVHVKNKTGIHARPAGKISREASKFKDTRISIIKGEMSANAKSILSILGIEAITNCELILEADGPEEKEAIAALKTLFESSFVDESKGNKN
ncbi:HPr family phosphocarrier protein [Spirochaetota bacterium]